MANTTNTEETNQTVEDVTEVPEVEGVELDNDIVTTEVASSVEQDVINKERILAFVRALCIVITSVMTYFGYSIDSESLFTVISTVLMGLSIVWGYWKNNNWTELAIIAQQILKSFRTTNNLESIDEEADTEITEVEEA